MPTIDTLTEQDLKDLETIRKVRTGEILKKVCGDYTILNGDFARRMPHRPVVFCQDCKYFAIKDYWGDFNGHPILATSDAPTCTKWGTGDCLTRPDGFCFLAERREADGDE